MAKAQRKAQARLARRIKAWEDTKGKKHQQHRPGSMKAR